MRPTLRRSSVEEFGRWYHAREAERSERREKQRARGQAARTPPMPNGYLTTVEAAARTGLSSKTLIRRAKPLGAVQRGRRWWIPAEAADEIHRQLRRERVESALDAKSWSPSERQQGSSAATTAQCSPTPSGAPSSDGVRRATNLHSVAAPSTASPANRIKNAASAKPRAPDLCDRRTLAARERVQFATVGSSPKRWINAGLSPCNCSMYKQKVWFARAVFVAHSVTS